VSLNTAMLSAHVRKDAAVETARRVAMSAATMSTDEDDGVDHSYERTIASSICDSNCVIENDDVTVCVVDDASLVAVHHFGGDEERGMGEMISKGKEKVIEEGRHTHQDCAVSQRSGGNFGTISSSLRSVDGKRDMEKEADDMWGLAFPAQCSEEQQDDDEEEEKEEVVVKFAKNEIDGAYSDVANVKFMDSFSIELFFTRSFEQVQCMIYFRV